MMYKLMTGRGIDLQQIGPLAQVNLNKSDLYSNNNIFDYSTLGSFKRMLDMVKISSDFLIILHWPAN